MDFRYKVHKYSIDQLVEILSQVSEATTEEVSQKPHLKYLSGYLQEINAKTIVAEFEYIDKDYIEDFAAYYVRSFHNYSRLCCRLHFFSNEFEENEFKELLVGASDFLNLDTIQDHYLGFIVVKPLPQTIIGRTCLITYPGTQRDFTVLRNYAANLFGLRLTVTTLAYQEQDSIVAACASSAIWSAFQRTGFLFQHSIPSPVEITRAATVHFPYANRHFPNKGLTPEQMAHAIRNVGLEPFLINARSHDFLTSSIYAYIKGKIPMIFGVMIVEAPVHGKAAKELGRHAVTITGFELAADKVQFTDKDFYLKSSRIKKIYVHDDGVGPFAKMQFDKKAPKFSLSTGGADGTDRAIPELLIIPLYHKIRIPYKSILGIIYSLDQYIKTIAKNAESPLPDFEWNIFLSEIADFKESIFISTLQADYKRNILTTKLPRFIWRALCEVDGSPRIEFLFDATDIEQGKIFVTYVEYDDAIGTIFKTIAEGTDSSAIAEVHVRNIMEELKK